MRIRLVRHAPVAVKGLCYGQHDVPCEASASEAADLIEAALGEVPLDEIWCSPWARAREPAAELARRRGLPLRCDERLAELSMGSFEGRRKTGGVRPL